MQARALVVCGAALITGCSLVLAGELDEAREIVVGPGNADSGTSGGASSEASVANDAGDGGTSEGGLSPRGCAAYQPASKFCADFDDDAGLDGWSINDKLGASVLSSDEAYSAPSSAKVTMNGGGAQNCNYSRIDRNFENIGLNRKVTVTFRMRMQSPWPDGMIPFVVEQFPNGGNQFCAALYFIESKDGKATGARLDVQSETTDNHLAPLTGYPSTDEWSEMKVVIERIGGGVRYTSSFTDPSGLTVTDSSDFSECSDYVNVAIHLGAHCNSQDATMFFDDVRVDWE